MDVSGSGGGYFYGPFVSTQVFGNFTVIPDPLIGKYGAWSHLPGPLLTGRGRWLQLTAWPDDIQFAYNIQIGIGPAGAEKVYQPSDGNGFFVNWFGGFIWAIPFSISFPTSTGVGKELCIRCASLPGGGPNLSAVIYLWN